jgi:hypothetical protein
MGKNLSCVGDIRRAERSEELKGKRENEREVR